MKRVGLAVIIALIAFALLAGPRAHASNDAALATFAAAEQAFEAEDFSRARALFEQALAAGIEGPAIHYNIGAASYLGGDLGVDSREMLEIWYEIEQRIGVRVDDAEKRDLYTLGDVVALLDRKWAAAAEPVAATA